MSLFCIEETGRVVTYEDPHANCINYLFRLYWRKPIITVQDIAGFSIMYDLLIIMYFPCLERHWKHLL